LAKRKASPRIIVGGEGEMKPKEKDMEQCKKCGVPKYRHPYYSTCGHDFLSISEEEEGK